MAGGNSFFSSNCWELSKNITVGIPQIAAEIMDKRCLFINKMFFVAGKSGRSVEPNESIAMPEEVVSFFPTRLMNQTRVVS